MKAGDTSLWKNCERQSNCSYKFVLLPIRQYLPVRVRDPKVRLFFAFLPNSVFTKLDFVISCPGSKSGSSLTPVIYFHRRWFNLFFFFFPLIWDLKQLWGGRQIGNKRGFKPFASPLKEHCCPWSRPTLLLQPQPHHQSYSARSCRSSVCCHSRDVRWKKPSVCEQRAQRAVAASVQHGMCEVHSSKRFPNKKGKSG